jgi:hypothetical protein
MKITYLFINKNNTSHALSVTLSLMIEAGHLNFFRRPLVVCGPRV